MKRFAIYRGPRSKSTAGLSPPPPPRRVATVEATGVVDALGQYVHEKYHATFNQQYGGHRVEWTTQARWPEGWRAWNGTDDPGTRGRDWRLVVTLRNGRNVHEAVFTAQPDWR